MSSKFNKSEIIAQFLTKMEDEIKLLSQNLKDIQAETTHEESKPENEYDTRAIESGYLAKAQSIRLLDAKDALAAFKSVEIKKFTEASPISTSALIQVDYEGKKLWFLYMPAGGGYSIQYQGIKIQVVTSKSPLGDALLGLKLGDISVVESPEGPKEYEILQIH